MMSLVGAGHLDPDPLAVVKGGGSGTKGYPGGGDIVGNGGGCAELLSRASFNRLHEYINACLLGTAPCGKSEAENAALKLLLEELPLGQLDSLLVFSDSKYEACKEVYGLSSLGVCVSPQIEDNNFYIKSGLLYDTAGKSIVTTENALTLLTDLFLQKRGVAEDVRLAVKQRLETVARKSWIELVSHDAQHRHLKALYAPNAQSVADDLIVGDGEEFYRASDLIKERDPCRYKSSNLQSMTITSPHWSGAELVASAKFVCEGGLGMVGEFVIRFAKLKEKPTVAYRGLN